MEQREVWDTIAKSWNDRRDVVQEDVSSFLDGKTGLVLDLGCGSGRNMFKSKDLKFYGVDFSSEMIRLAEEKARREGIFFEGMVRDAWDIGYSSDFFDLGIYCSALSCIETEENRIKSLRELYRVLKIGGEAMIRVWSRNSPRLKGKKGGVLIPWEIEGEKVDRYYHVYTIEELRAEIEAAGFIVLDSFENENIVFRVRKG